MYKLNLNKLKSTQKSRASLLANSYRLEMNIITSVLTYVITISLIFGVFVLMNIIFGLNCILHILLYALALLELVFQTIFMYRKKAVSKLMRCESW
jgi:hypothetical protein